MCSSGACETRSIAVPSNHTFIQTRYGVGYRFEPVTKE